uniref:Uncharacterized protein n=1 Tax=Oryza meridionalis TaxID=40149 RepID=A0A0E0DIG6_9ORYZ
MAAAVGEAATARSSVAGAVSERESGSGAQRSNMRGKEVEKVKRASLVESEREVVSEVGEHKRLGGRRTQRVRQQCHRHEREVRRHELLEGVV